MRFSIFQESRKGGREANQDRTGYAYTRDALLMVIADGMGGHLHGEVASQIAAQLLTEAFQREAKPKLADPFGFLQKSITDAHFALGDYAKARRLIESPRTTCVACVVQDSTAFWAHVGDSRLYHIREGRIQAQTRDHSRVQMLVDQHLHPGMIASARRPLRPIPIATRSSTASGRPRSRKWSCRSPPCCAKTTL